MTFLRFIGFSVVRAWQGFWRNAMMSLAATATVVLMLVLLAGLFVVLSGMDSGLKFIESKVAVTARLQDNLSAADRDALLAYVRRLPGVRQVTYVSPEMAMDRLRQAYADRGQKLETGGAKITLYASIEVALTSPSYASSVTDALLDPAHRAQVAQITTKQSEYDKLVGIINVIRTVGIIALVLVGLTVLFMIVNTIRIAVYARAGEIEIMRLVGASDSFIRWPFILEGILGGVLAALFSGVIVFIGYGIVLNQAKSSLLELPYDGRFLTLLLAGLFAGGAALGAFGSYLGVRRFLSA